jgi:hypothetical protein
MIVLDELDFQASRLPECSLVVTLEKEPALVAENLGLQDEDVRDLGASKLQSSRSSRIRSRYSP